MRQVGKWGSQSRIELPGLDGFFEFLDLFREKGEIGAYFFLIGFIFLIVVVGRMQEPSDDRLAVPDLGAVCRFHGEYTPSVTCLSVY